jgi:hypothetical protein
LQLEKDKSTGAFTRVESNVDQLDFKGNKFSKFNQIGPIRKSLYSNRDKKFKPTYNWYFKEKLFLGGVYEPKVRTAKIIKSLLKQNKKLERVGVVPDKFMFRESESLHSQKFWGTTHFKTCRRFIRRIVAKNLNLGVAGEPNAENNLYVKRSYFNNVILKKLIKRYKSAVYGDTDRKILDLSRTIAGRQRWNSYETILAKPVHGQDSGGAVEDDDESAETNVIDDKEEFSIAHSDKQDTTSLGIGYYNKSGRLYNFLYRFIGFGSQQRERKSIEDQVGSLRHIYKTNYINFNSISDRQAEYRFLQNLLTNKPFMVRDSKDWRVANIKLSYTNTDFSVLFDDKHVKNLDLGSKRLGVKTSKTFFSILGDLWSSDFIVGVFISRIIFGSGRFRIVFFRPELVLVFRQILSWVQFTIKMDQWGDKTYVLKYSIILSLLFWNRSVISVFVSLSFIAFKIFYVLNLHVTSIYLIRVIRRRVLAWNIFDYSVWYQSMSTISAKQGSSTSSINEFAFVQYLIVNRIYFINVFFSYFSFWFWMLCLVVAIGGVWFPTTAGESAAFFTSSGSEQENLKRHIAKRITSPFRG